MTKQRRINDIKGMNADWKNLIKSWEETIEHCRERISELEIAKSTLREMKTQVNNDSVQYDALGEAMFIAYL